MTRTLLVAALLLTLSMPVSEISAQSNDRYGTQMAAYDVNYSGGDGNTAHFKALRNVQNHLNAVGKDNIKLKVVLSGDGVDMLKDAATNLKLQNVISNLKVQNVVFLVCNNTLVGRNIDPDSLFEVFKDQIVPSGNAELAHLQRQGYAYLKP